MKKKKYLLISLVIIGCILILTFVISSLNNRGTIDKLMSQLESAINKHNIESIVELYPDYYQNKVNNQLSQTKIDEFYDNVIANNKIQIEIVSVSNLDLSDAKNIQDKINQEYNTNINIQDYQLVTINYHEDFGESTFQVIKIDGEYYLYAESYLPEPIQYFTK